MSNFDIRAMEGLGMKKIELYLADDFKDIFTGWPEWDEVKVFRTLSVADDVNLWDRAINLDGKFYSVRMSQGNKYKIRELKEFNLEKKRTMIQAKLHALFVDMNLVIVGNMIQTKVIVNVEVVELLWNGVEM